MYITIIIQLPHFRYLSLLLPQTLPSSAHQNCLRICILCTSQVIKYLSRPFVITPPPHDGMLFHDLSQLSIKSVCTNPNPNPYEHTHSQSQKPHHMNSPCFICYNKKFRFKKFTCRMLYISIFWFQQQRHMVQITKPCWRYSPWTA